MAKWKFDQSQENHGIIAELEFDLSKEKPTKYLRSPNLLHFTAVSVEIIMIGVTNATGSATIHETNDKQGDKVYTTGVTLALATDTNVYAKATSILSRYIAIETPDQGDVGKMIYRLVAKES